MQDRRAEARRVDAGLRRGRRRRAGVGAAGVRPAARARRRRGAGRAGCAPRRRGAVQAATAAAALTRSRTEAAGRLGTLVADEARPAWPCRTPGSRSW
nr:hypothetical protein [Angustibacter aerolatus]